MAVPSNWSIVRLVGFLVDDDGNPAPPSWTVTVQSSQTRLQDSVSHRVVIPEPNVLTPSLTDGYFWVDVVSDTDTDITPTGRTHKITLDQNGVAVQTWFATIDHTAAIQLPFDDTTQAIVASDGTFHAAVWITSLEDFSDAPVVTGLNLSSYFTAAQTTSAVDAKMAGHVAAADPHAQYALDSDLTAKADQSALTAHVADTANPHSVTKAQVGLGSVDNTSDASKPVSTAQQTALNGKQPLDADLTALAALAAGDGNVIMSVFGSWASRTMAQLKTSLGLVKGDVGLGSVDNTSDVAKPVSTAQATAIAAKADSSALTAEVGRATGAESTLTTAVSGKAATSHTHAESAVTGLTSDLATKAPLASPTFTGTVTVPTPSGSTDAATKAYVDAVATGLVVKTSAVALATSNVASLSGLAAVDGVTPTAGQRLLLVGQTTASQNGLWLAGSGSWTRPTDYATGATITPGAFVFVAGGTTNAGSGWALQGASAITVDTTGTTWTQFSNSATISAGTGLSQTGNTLNNTGVLGVTAADSTVTVSGTSANPTVAVAAIAESKVTGLTSDLAAKATAARQITAGTGLTGGGDLTADRALAVAYGTTSGTAAQGNDSRITGAAADSAVIHNAGAETVAGTKTFTSPPVVPTPTASGHAVTKAYADAVTGAAPDATTSTKGIVQLAGDLGGTASSPTVPALAAKAADSAVVHNTGAESVAGTKTFTSPPLVPTPTDPGHAVTKAYADALGGTGGTTTAPLQFLVDEVAARQIAVEDLRIAVNGRYRWDRGVGIPEQDLSDEVIAKLNPAVAGGTDTTAAGGSLSPGEVRDQHLAANAGISEDKLALASDAHPATPSRRTLGTGPLQAMPGNTVIPVVGTNVPPLDGSGKVPNAYLPAGNTTGATTDTTYLPRPLGITAAGTSTTLASPRDHVHARPADPQPVDIGAISWSMDPASMTTGIAAPVGVMQLARLWTPGGPITGVGMVVSAAPTSLTNCHTVLFDANGNLLAQSANRATAWIGGMPGDRNGDLSSAQSPAPGYVYAGFWVGGGTFLPYRGGTSAVTVNPRSTVAGLRFLTAGSGLTTSAPSAVALTTANTTAYFLYTY